MGVSSQTSALRVFGRYRDLIPEFDGFLGALRGELPTALRINTLLASAESVRRGLENQWGTLNPTPLGALFWLAPGISNPGYLLEHLMGLVYAQSLSSALAALALRPKPGEIALDLCAAPGGKTTHMAQEMENTGRIIANEPVRRRHASLQSNLRRLGVGNTVITAYDGQNFPMRWRFPKILVDAPCSGEGNGRIDCRGRIRGFGPTTKDFSGLQKALLLRAFDLLTEEGVMVYATCTYDPRENEAVLDELLKTRPARVAPLNLDVPHDPGVTTWAGKRYHREVEHAWRIYPHRLPTVGFFLAKIARR